MTEIWNFRTRFKKWAGKTFIGILLIFKSEISFCAQYYKKSMKKRNLELQTETLKVAFFYFLYQNTFIFGINNRLNWSQIIATTQNKPEIDLTLWNLFFQLTTNCVTFFSSIELMSKYGIFNAPPSAFTIY